MSKILITGGTGLIGKELQKKLISKNHEVVILSRNPKKKNEFLWNISDGFIDGNAFKDITHIIHLAGAGIANKKWTNKRKQELINSRVKSANLLFTKIKELKIELKGFISASGIGYYGAFTSEEIFSEDHISGNDFIAKVCIEWEKATHKFSQLNIPVTILRTGIVLAKSGGALPKINTPLFLATLGNGKQYMPWIHIDDLCNIYLKAVENIHFTGVYNAIAPEHETNKSFTKKLSKTIAKPIFPLNAPSFILKMVLGEMSSILLKGSRVSSVKTSAIYSFIFTDLKSALKNIYHNE
ncbi:TIGR01777 family oxidoreductase [Tenacibaculum haliotis]|uniref:TIGR01777 family oxidoreductase n=1 Tax=Tenacibaculum haliotis TaxID=1888914 RepID=UPI0021AF7F6C|nr:TIGR01777 family oxidoreductase [Tenacibaculum haliotis]MCT4698287.1 TIGR01777 family oxidoreductase [Tenacibaculum haliotis]